MYFVLTRRGASSSAATVQSKAQRRHVGVFPANPREAEREGFEPSMDETAHTGFRDRRIQPLCHLSG